MGLGVPIILALGFALWFFRRDKGKQYTSDENVQNWKGSAQLDGRPRHEMPVTERPVKKAVAEDGQRVEPVKMPANSERRGGNG